MLARSQRLTPPSHVRRTQRTGRRLRAGCLVVHYCPTGDGRVRAAVVVGKGHGGSVHRHRRQRQVRHALAAALPSLPSGDYVVRVLSGGDQSWPALCSDLARAMGRL